MHHKSSPHLPRSSTKPEAQMSSYDHDEHIQDIALSVAECRVADIFEASPEMKQQMAKLVYITHSDNKTFMKANYKNLYKGDTDMDTALEVLFYTACTYPKQEGEKLGLDLFVFVNCHWQSVLSKIRSYFKLLGNIDALDFESSAIHWIHVENLYKLYTEFEPKEKFPSLILAMTDISERPEFYQKLLEEKPDDFRKKLIF